MNVGEATIPRGQTVRLRVQVRELAGFALLAALWGVFVSWFILAMSGDALAEALAAVGTLGLVLGLYSMATVCWVAFNAVLYLVRGPAKPRDAPMPEFDKDHFGRPVVVAPGAAFSAQSLVLEFRDGQKVYRAPIEDGLQEVAAASDLMSLSAAAGHSVSPESAGSASQTTSGDRTSDERTVPSS